MRYLITFFLVLILIGGCKKEDSTPVTPVQDTPTVKIVNPVNNQNILDSVTIQIEASDPKGVTKVELFIQNNMVKEFAVKPYTYFWDVKSLPDSSQYSIYAKAYNSDDKVTGSEVINVTINRLSPSNLEILSLSKDTVHLKWKDNSIVEESYVIQVSTDSVSFNTIAELPANTTEANITYSFDFGIRYYFRVGAIKNSYVSHSIIASTKLSLEAPQLISPQNNEENIITSPMLEWKVVKYADSYTVQIASDILFSNIISVVSNLTENYYNVSSLQFSTSYFWRVKAKNYFEESDWSFSNLFTTFSACEGVNLLDYLGKTYNTIAIKNQCWLKENLNVGEMVLGNQEQSNNGVIEKYCYNDLESNCVKYGGLYQWSEAVNYDTILSNKGICPLGWHIPTANEFQILKSYVNGNGKSLKNIGEGSGTGLGNNTSGFSALLSGYRDFNGSYYNLTYDIYLWSSTHTSNQFANNLRLYSIVNDIHINNSNKNYGFSVRCIKD